MSKTAFIFPGQGAQKTGMGKDFYETFPMAKEVFDQASEWLSLDMKELCFEPNDRLDLTEYTQAAMVTACLAMKRVVEAHGLKADIAAGLSLGEYCAVETAGGMSLRDAVTAVRQRGILMEHAVPAGKGSMAAVIGMEDEEIENVLRPLTNVSVANYNCPGQTVITGETGAVAEASKLLKEAGARRVLPLKVSGPFHSPMLAEAGKELDHVLAQVEFTPLNIPYVTNVTAKAVTDAADIRELLVKQISSSVRWRQSVENMIASGVDTFVEIGPGKTLTGFLKKIDSGVRAYSIQTIEDLKKVLLEIQNLG